MQGSINLRFYSSEDNSYFILSGDMNLSVNTGRGTLVGVNLTFSIVPFKTISTKSSMITANWVKDYSKFMEKKPFSYFLSALGKH